MIQKERLTILSPGKKIRNGDYVLYWMQAAQRTEANFALEYAIHQANKRNLPLIVFFGLTGQFPDANLRHYYFLLEGLQDVSQSLYKRGIQLIIRYGSPEHSIQDLAADASLVVVDQGYLRIQRDWRSSVAHSLDCPFTQVESEVLVPLQTASPKEEYSAATIRPKIHKNLQRFLVETPPEKILHPSASLDIDSVSIQDLSAALHHLSLDTSVAPVPHLHGGTREAHGHLYRFIKQDLDVYHLPKNNPGHDVLSHMSPYLHFGQISPLTIALGVMAHGGPGAQAYLEELIIRRELACNFVFYNPHYDSFQGLPPWAVSTLSEHATDRHDYQYSPSELEKADTHDPYWNAAQLEMVKTGKMHGYMRMYWGKKVIEWSPTPQKAYQNLVALNNKFELDGRDPNGFAGIAWCFGKHDRPWPERPIFGKIRYMTSQGLTRKFDMDTYIEKIDNLTSAMDSDGKK
jgi:deoxyribodipyrimidine photo-lyase